MEASQVALEVTTPPPLQLPTNSEDIRDMDLIPGLGRSTGGGHGNPLHYSCMEKPLDREACWATAHRIAKSQTGLKQFSTPSMQI